MSFSPFSTLNSTPTAITTKAMQAAIDLEEKERKQAAQLNKDFYYGKQEQTLQLMNDDVEPIILNLTKPIMDKRCSMLYNRPLVREMVGPAKSRKFLEKVYKDNTIDALLNSADLLSELTGSCLVHPFVDPALPSGIRLRLYDGTQFSTVGNDLDPNTADAISLVRVVDHLIDAARLGPRNQPQVERIMEQQIWTNDAVVFYQGEQVVSSQENPLGFLPFVNFKGQEVHDSYVGAPQAADVRKLNHQINQLLTHLGFTIKMQAGTPIVLSGFSSGETVVVHPGRALNIPAGAAASVLKLDPKINEMLETINYLEQRLFSSSGVPKISVEGGDGDKTHISGTQLMVRWYPLMQVFHEKTVRFDRYELQLANMILHMVDMAPLEDVEVLWPEERVLPFSPNEERLEQDIRLNLVTPIDELMRRNPSLTEKDAQAEWMANMDLNAMNNSTSNNNEGDTNGLSPQNT